MCKDSSQPFFFFVKIGIGNSVQKKQPEKLHSVDFFSCVISHVLMQEAGLNSNACFLLDQLTH